MEILFDYLFEEIPSMTDEECYECDNEIWKDMGNGISVSNYGNVISKNYKITNHKNNGYMYVNHIPVSRLVAIAFIDNPDNLPIVDHIDGNRSNNKVSNLRWVSTKANSKNKHNFNYSKIGNMPDILDRYYRRKKQKKNDRDYELYGDLFPELERSSEEYYKKKKY